MPPRPIHDPRRPDCPWCGSGHLRTLLRTPDLRHPGRPGVFTVDTCAECAHTFQNPRLTPEGLALYPADPDAAARRWRLRGTARVMLPFGEPESWLDVGTGDAWFPEAAKDLFTYTAFDGVDATPRVVRAREAGRLEEAHQGDLTDPALTTRLRARYDVVSILHHLGHTPEPRATLRAALTALRPSGHLLLRLPNPRSASARLLGRRWPHYDQPRHLHLIPPPNLCAELEAQNCTIVTRPARNHLATTYQVIARKNPTR